MLLCTLAILLHIAGFRDCLWGIKSLQAKYWILDISNEDSVAHLCLLQVKRHRLSDIQSLNNMVAILAELRLSEIAWLLQVACSCLSVHTM